MTLIKVKSRGTEVVSGRRNLIHNGAMKVAARGTITGHTTGGISCDRYRLVINGGAAVTTSQDANVPNLSNGFRNSLKIDCTTADTSVAAGDYAILYQRIEGQDLQHLLYGTTAHKKVTVQFWVKSAKTGIHTVELYHLDAVYFNSQQYTISSADTWEKKIVTFVGYPTTTFDNDANGSLQLAWWLLGGSTYSGGTHNSNTWHNTTANRAVGQVNVLDNTANNFYLTGVQMEVGDSASDFEHVPIGEETDICRRYYQKLQGTSYYGGFHAYTGSSSVYIHLSPPMRAAPTVSNYAVRNGSTGASASNISAGYISAMGFNCAIDGAGGSDTHFSHINQSFVEASADI